MIRFNLFNEKSTFEEKLSEGAVTNEDVSFIKDSKEIYTNNCYWGGDIKTVGKDVTGTVFNINGSNTTAGTNAEIFNDYTNNIASGKYSHAEGYQTIAKGSYTHAEGYGTFANGAAAHAEGYNTQATARYAHAEGASCIASGNNSHAEGNESKSVGHYSHAEGNVTTANGGYSHTEGNYTKTGENGTYAHAEGSYTEANSVGCHAEGNHTISAAAFAHTEGMYTKAISPYQHVRGKYNAIDTEGKYNTIIGNGTSESDRRNIFTIDWVGNVICDGKITINDSCEIVNDGDLVSLKYLQTVLNNNENVDKTYVDNAIAGLVDGAPETLDTLNELAAALNDNADIVDVLNQSISNKQNAITDLETIRQGAAKGATALQSYTEQYKGTVTGVKINGETKNPSSGVIDLGYINKQLSASTSSSMTLSPNIYYRNTSTSLSTLTITLASASNSNVINEYFVEFTTSSSGTTISLPSTIKWANGETPTFEANTTYQISIVNNLGIVTKFK
jgi:hypothetical protein